MDKDTSEPRDSVREGPEGSGGIVLKPVSDPRHEIRRRHGENARASGKSEGRSAGIRLRPVAGSGVARKGRMPDGIRAYGAGAPHRGTRRGLGIPPPRQTATSGESRHPFGDPEEEQWWGMPALYLEGRTTAGAAGARPGPPTLAQGRARPDPAPARRGIGRLAQLAVVSSVGLCICCLADALSRATLNPSIWIFWSGIALIVAPIFVRLCGDEASVGERLGLVILLGLQLFLVKLMRDPFGYTLGDEFFHAHNAQRILVTHRLFGSDTILPISTKYPGLEGATSSLMFLTGMSSFGAGNILIGAAQIMLMVGLYVLFMAVSGSWRVAGIGAAAYAANSNFLYFGADYSYQSLSLPLFVVLLALLAMAANVRGPKRTALTPPIVLVIGAIVVTHHLTSYIMDGTLVALAAICWLFPVRTRRVPARWQAGVGIALVLGWLVVVGSEIVGYISPVVNQAFVQTLSELNGESPPHAPFSSSSGLVTPVAERIVSLASVSILLLALPFGLLEVWRRHRRDPLALILWIAAILYFGFLGLRLTPSAWEIANRSDQFLFIGLAFVAANAVVFRILRLKRRRLGSVLVGGAAAIAVVGSAIAGWEVNNVMTPPFVIRAGGHDIPSQTLALGRWVDRHLRGAGFAAADADARVLLLDANAHVITAYTGGVDNLLSATQVNGSELQELGRLGLRYVVVDTRKRSTDNANGYAFSTRPAGGTPDALWPRGIATKFDQLPAPRIYDSGDISIYDLKGNE